MSENSPDIATVIGRMPLFAGLGADAAGAMARATMRRRLKKEQQVYRQGDSPHAFFYVISGHVRRAIASSEGEEKVIDILSPGDHFGLAELFSDSAYVSFAEAVDAAEVLEIDRAGIGPAMEADSAVGMRLLAAVAEGQVALERDVAAYFFQSGPRRLLDYLLREAGPRLAPTGDTVVELPVSKRLIAARLGVSAGTLSRALRELSDAGLISVRGRQIVLREKLAARRAAAQGQPAVPGVREGPERRRRDPWVERGALNRPLASRAWL